MRVATLSGTPISAAVRITKQRNFRALSPRHETLVLATEVDERPVWSRPERPSDSVTSGPNLRLRQPAAYAILPDMAVKERLILPAVWKANQVTQKYIYPYFTRRMSADVVFLNVGYEEDPPMAIPLDAADETFRPCIQLYHRVATQVDLEGKTVLEVGCGHGGGASYLTRTLRPASYTGLDLNSAGIDFCRRRHMVPGLDFVQGNAEELPFPDRSFDAVINLESSLFYAHFPRFLSEVARVLGFGGHCLYADLRPSYRVAEWEKTWPKHRCGCCHNARSTPK